MNATYTYWKPYRDHPTEIQGMFLGTEVMQTNKNQFEVFIVDADDRLWSVGVLGWKLKKAFAKAQPMMGGTIGIRYIDRSQGYLNCLVVTTTPVEDEYRHDTFEDWAYDTLLESE